MSYREEFPDFKPEDMPAIPTDWVDCSWRNDTCPSFGVVNEINAYVHVDFADAAQREFPEANRFQFIDQRDGDYVVLADTNEWADVVAAVVKFKESLT